MKREDILISFIHMPTDSKPNQPIDPIRIMKGLFLMKMEMSDKLSKFYNFEPYLYGPCSFEVYEDLEKLKIIGNKYGLKDIREANVMKFDNKFKIVDAERR